MSNFGKAQETGEGTVRKIFTGVENFKVVAVNPTHEQLKGMFGDNAREDVYVSTSEIKDADGNVTGTVAQSKIVFHLDNQNEEMPIKTRLTFYVNKQNFVSTAKGTIQVINVYGKTAWLTQEQIDQALPNYTLVGGKNGTYPFDGTGMRKSYRGEAEMITTLRRLLGLGNPDKAEDKSTVTSQFSIQDWDTFFGGNFKLLQGIIETSPNKIGVLLGAKTVESNVYQDVFNREVMAAYVKNSGRFDYLRKQVENSQSNGGFSSTDFGDPSYKLAEYAPDAQPSAPGTTAQANVPGFTPTAFDASAASAFATK